MNIAIKTFLAVLLFSAGIAVEAATENRWTGAAGPAEDGFYYYTNALNWARGRVPTTEEKDIPVFDVDGEITVLCDGNVAYWHGLKVYSGHVTFTNPPSARYIFVPGTIGIYVTNNASFNVAGGRFADGYSPKGIVKTGEGDLTVTQIDGNDNYSVEVTEGTLTAGRYNIKTLTVRTNATFRSILGNVMTRHTDVHLDAGSCWDVASEVDGKYFKVGNLTGSGNVTNSTGALVYLDMIPSADAVYSGRFSPEVNLALSATATGRFILGATNVLEDVTLNGDYGIEASARLGFLAGVEGPFVFGCWKPNAGYPLDLEDTDGNPVTVIASSDSGFSAEGLATSGAGDFYLRSGTGVFKGAGAGHSGVLGALAGTLTLGDLTDEGDCSLSTVSVLDAAGGSLMIRNASPLEFGGTLKGDGYVKAFGDMTIANLEKSSGDLVLGGDLTMEDGSLRASCLKFGGSGSQTFTHSGGSFVFRDDYVTPNSTATADDPVRIVFDGTTVDFDFSEKAKTGYTIYPFKADKSGLKIEVTKKGVHFRSTGITDAAVGTGAYVEMYPEIFSDEGGMVTQSGIAGFSYWNPVITSGGFTGKGSQSRFRPEARLADDGSAFGSGKVTLENHQLYFFNRAETETISFPGGLHVKGSGLIRMRYTVDGVRQNFAFSSLSFEEGSALFLKDTGGYPGTDAGAIVTVEQPLTVSAGSGRVIEPVFVMDNGHESYKFVTYDAETKRIAPLTDGILEETAMSNTDSTKLVHLLAGDSRSAEGAALAAEGLVCDRGMTLRLGDGATLSVGNGKSPAVILMQASSTLTVVSSAEAWLDFGTSAGLIVAGDDAHDGYYSRLGLPIRSAAGLTLLSASDSTHWRGFELFAANTYSGGTRIASAGVKASNTGCFSDGEVDVTSGGKYGGQVQFSVQDGVWQNDFRIEGKGFRNDYQAGQQQGKYLHGGALSFEKDGCVAGSVELAGTARIIALDGVTGTVSGIVSGGRLEVVDSAGLVKLSGNNVYDGGTDISRGTLALCASSAAGTGPIELGGGTLVFDAAEAMTVANAITGEGTLRIAGAGAVALTGDLSGMSVQTIEITPGIHALAQTPLPCPLLALGDGFADRTKLVLKSGGAYTLSQELLQGHFEIILESGATLDLGGATVTVDRFTGDRYAVNGKFEQLHPLPGLRFMVR